MFKKLISVIFILTICPVFCNAFTDFFDSYDTGSSVCSQEDNYLCGYPLFSDPYVSDSSYLSYPYSLYINNIYPSNRLLLFSTTTGVSWISFYFNINQIPDFGSLGFSFCHSEGLTTSSICSFTLDSVVLNISYTGTPGVYKACSGVNADAFCTNSGLKVINNIYEHTWYKVNVRYDNTGYLTYLNGEVFQQEYFSTSTSTANLFFSWGNLSLDYYIDNISSDNIYQYTTSSYDYACGIGNCSNCYSSSTCEFVGCRWADTIWTIGDGSGFESRGFCTDYDTISCGTGDDLINCTDQSSCELQGGIWGVGGICWATSSYFVIPYSSSTWYSTHSNWSTSTQWWNDMTGSITPILARFDEIFSGFTSFFDLSEADAMGDRIGSSIPFIRGYLLLIDGWLGGFPFSFIFISFFLILIGFGVWRILLFLRVLFFG